MGKLKGVHPPHRKNTTGSATVQMTVPDKVYIVMHQHMGPPCDVLVKVGDEVKVGQVIGDSQAFLTAPIHASVSGKVVDIGETLMPNGARSKTVVIQSDKMQQHYDGMKAPVVTDKDSFIKAVRESGVVGLGGAGFPVHVKLSPKNLSEVDTLVVNAAECEPYITSDYRTIIERSEDIMDGILAMMKYLDIQDCVIGVEDNKPAGIELLCDVIKSRGLDNVRVKVLEAMYPQGAEKMLIYQCTGRVLPEGKLPADIGCIVNNVTTIAVIARYLRDGVPLISKYLTVDGGAVTTPMNVRALIGTTIKDLVDFCGGFKGEPKKIMMGGPMMGTAIFDENFPVLKNNNAILAFDESQVNEYDETACIRCGRCVRACPMNLMPLRIEGCFERGDDAGLDAFKVMLCIECGCCSYDCPAKRHLVQTNRLAKTRLRQLAAAKKQT